MADRLKELLSKILEWWNKFSTKQKTFIISAGRHHTCPCSFDYSPDTPSVCPFAQL